MSKRPRRRAGLSRALGLSSKSRSSSRRLSSVSHDALRRASPAEIVRMGFTPKARRYVKAGVKVTKSTATVSARQAETKRVRAVYGMASPEIATQGPRTGSLSYRIGAGARRRRKRRKTPLTSRNCAARLKTPQSAASGSTNMPDRASLSLRQSA